VRFISGPCVRNASLARLRRQTMLKVLLGSSIGILSIVTVVGAILVVAFWSWYMYKKSSK